MGSKKAKGESQREEHFYKAARPVLQRERFRHLERGNRRYRGRAGAGAGECGDKGLVFLSGSRPLTWISL